MNQHVKKDDFDSNPSISYEKFPQNVVDELKFYVYRLIDPRNGETFYVGKGVGNRLFAHINDALNQEATESDKLDRIRDIENSTLKVAHVIHRHGMTEDTAKEVEGALIDTYSGLTNIQGGTGNNVRGAMHADEIMIQYHAPTAEFHHKVMLIKLKHSDRPLYEQIRFSWKVSKAKAEKADYVMAVRNGIIQKVFVAEKWLQATSENFPGRDSEPHRHGFVGHEASDEIQKKYVRKRIPSEYSKRGNASPFLYSFK